MKIRVAWKVYKRMCPYWWQFATLRKPTIERPSYRPRTISFAMLRLRVIGRRQVVAGILDEGVAVVVDGVRARRRYPKGTSSDLRIAHGRTIYNRMIEDSRARRIAG
jgi:hypothetical protein